MINTAISGFDIAYVEMYIASGALQRDLADWSPFFEGYYLNYPSRRQALPALKVIVDALRH